jgi:hypothetical protein
MESQNSSKGPPWITRFVTEYHYPNAPALQVDTKLKSVRNSIVAGLACQRSASIGEQMFRNYLGNGRI